MKINNTLLILLGISLLTTISCREEPPPVEYNTNQYKLDNWTSAETAVFQGGFVSGERAAVTIGPINETFIMNSVEFLFGGSTETKSVKLFIYWDEGTTKPGELLLEKTYELTGNDNVLQKIQLKGELLQDIIFHGGGMCRIALQFNHAGFPCIARDDDGSFSKGKNWIYVNNNWTGSENEGIKDDFIIRANIDTQKK